MRESKGNGQLLKLIARRPSFDVIVLAKES
jgi:hypothetical protein